MSYIRSGMRAPWLWILQLSDRASVPAESRVPCLAACARPDLRPVTARGRLAFHRQCFGGHEPLCYLRRGDLV